MNSAEGKQKLKAACIIGTLFAALCGLIFLYLYLDDGPRAEIPQTVSIEPYTHEKIEGMEISGVFTETAMSSSVSKELKTDGSLILTNYSDFSVFMSEFRDIYTTTPEFVSGAKRRFEDGYAAIIISVSEYSLPCSIYASCKYTGDSGKLVIVLISEELNPAYTYNTDPSKCQQAAAVAFIKRDLLNAVNSVTILVNGV